MKNLLCALFGLFLIAHSSHTFAQNEGVVNDSTVSRSTRFKFFMSSSGVPGVKVGTAVSKRLALFSELAAATGSSVSQVNSVAPVAGNVSLISTNIPEGANLYFTAARFNTAGDARYPQLSGSYANPSWLASIPVSKVTGAEPAITAGTALQYLKGDKSLGTLNTTAVVEGTNLYYTDARSRLAHSITGPLTYNSTTGVFGIPVATNSVDGYLSAVDRLLFASKQSPATTIGGYGITDADPYQSVATYAAMNALTYAANTSRRVLVLADEQYAKTNQWYMVWADGSAVMHADKIVTITEK